MRFDNLRFVGMKEESKKAELQKINLIQHDIMFNNCYVEL